MTTLAAIEYLRSSEGAAQLRAAAELELTSQSLLRELTALRQNLSAEQASTVIEQAALRRRATTKFSRAADMLFTGGGLEQASGGLLAAHSAGRYAGSIRVADLCCGIGGDSLALAQQAPVVAYDIDPVRLACAAHNAAVYGLSSRIEFKLADVRTLDLSSGAASSAARTERTDAIFFDPSRRVQGRRIFSLGDYRPPVSIVNSWLPAIPAVGVKVAPGVLHDEVVWECEQEFVAEGPDLKEGLLWFGPLATTARRATVLPARVSLVDAEAPEPELGEPSAWLYDPSPAVTRAELVWELALLLGARQLDQRLGYLTGPDLIETPLARAYPIESWMPFNLKRLRQRLRLTGAGRVEVHRRGAPIEPALLERQLRQQGSAFRLVFITRVRGRLVAIICRNPQRGS